MGDRGHNRHGPKIGGLWLPSYQVASGSLARELVASWFASWSQTS